MGRGKIADLPQSWDAKIAELSNISIRILLVMQIRFALILLITSSFVFYAWELPDKAHQNIYVCINKNNIF
jgi:hypothetical protein